MMNRRDFLGLGVGAGASLVLAPQLLGAHRAPVPALIHRAIPSTGEQIPVVGLSFSNHPSCAERRALRDVLKTMVDSGGRVFDAMHGDLTAEEFHADLAVDLGVQERLFWSTRATAPGAGGPVPPGAAAVRSHVDMWKRKLGASRMDLVMLPASADPSHIAALKELKREGQVRYIGAQVISDAQFGQLEAVMRAEPLDFIGINYDVAMAGAEEKLLPLALERNIGVMAFFPFGNNGGVSCGSGANLFGRVGDRPLPDWAAEFDATTWSHFFLKYVISHPAVTVARVGTTKAHHMLDNMGGGVGRLPDEETRRRMAAFIRALPPVTMQMQSSAAPLVLAAPLLDRYVGDYRTADGLLLIVRRYGTNLTARAGQQPEIMLRPLSETRFSFGYDGRAFLQFDSDGSGRAPSLVFEQGRERTVASRIR